MTFSVQRSSGARYLLLRATPGDAFPDALLAALAAESVRHGWVRITGVLEDAELRAVVAANASSESRRVAGPVSLLTMDVLVAGGDAPLAFRGVVAVHGESDAEVLSAEILHARVRSMDVLVTVLDELTAAVAAGSWSAAVQAAARAESPGQNAPVAGRTASYVGGGPISGAPPAPLPPRPLRPSFDLDGPVPEVGDIVEHFAFGRGEVVKSDGDRLHVRMEKDGRIREIALERLLVERFAAVDDSSGGVPRAAHFKLQRRL